jgi:hypothetical protein
LLRDSSLVASLTAAKQDIMCDFMKILNFKLISIFFLVIVLLGCEKESGETQDVDLLENMESLPDFVYIPSENVVSDVLLSADSVSDVGDWVELNATRETTGDWLKVRRVEVPEEALWFASVPNGFEAEVADNVSWKVEPSENFKFEVASFKNINSLSRKIIFSKPGVYKLQAYSAFPVSSTSNIIEIRVE